MHLDVWRRYAIKKIVQWAESRGYLISKIDPRFVRARYPDMSSYEIRKNHEDPFDSDEWERQDGMSIRNLVWQYGWTSWFVYRRAAGLEEKRVVGDIVAGRFRDAIREALIGTDLASVVPDGRGVILDAGIGDGVLAIATVLGEVHVPVVVVEPEPGKRQADARLLVDIPVSSGLEEANRCLAQIGVNNPIVLTSAVTPTPKAALAYLQQLRLLPRDLQPQAVLAVGLEEGRFREQMGEYL